MQALIWLRDVPPSDHDKVAKRLKAILNDGDNGQRMRQDLQDHLGDLPDWLVPLVKDILNDATPPPPTRTP